MGLWHDSSKQKRISSIPCCSHLSCFLLCMCRRRYSFCEKLCSFRTALCFLLHTGHTSVLFLMVCLTQDSHSVWLQGSNIGMWLPSSSYSSKQTPQESMLVQLSRFLAIVVVPALSLSKWFKCCGNKFQGVVSFKMYSSSHNSSTL